MPIGTLWRWSGAIGVHPGLTPHEQKKIAVANHALGLGLTASVGYFVFYALAGVLAAAFINLGAVALYASALGANHLRHPRAGRHIAMVTANCHILSLSVVALGREAGVHYWFFMFIVLAFLLFPRTERIAIYGYAAVAVALFSGVENGLISLGEEPEISERLAFALHLVSTVTSLLVITAVVDVFDRETARAELAFAREHERSERLLLNILPPSIADRLKDEEAEIADSFPEVTVLFADIAGFTKMSGELDPHRIVSLLNEVFTEFDGLAEKHGLEKIKTIGDAYMVAGGLPRPHEDHAHAVAHMALDMAEVATRHRKPDGSPFEVRIGINTGPVVAGVIGQKKFIYDLWGDAVNTASRMESTGVIGEIQVTESTYERIRDLFDLESRGEVEVKGKGPMPTWFLRGRKTEPVAA